MSNTLIDVAGSEPIDLEIFELIGDVGVPLTAELDRSTVSVHELMRWKVDTVITLARPTGENIDLLAGGVVIGNAEILVLDGKLAVRVADLKDKPPTVHAPSSPSN